MTTAVNESLDSRIGALVATDSEVEYRQVLDAVQEMERHVTADGRRWVGVRDVIENGHVLRDLTGAILRSPFTIHWKEEKVGLYGLPAPFEPFSVGEWERMGGERLASLTGPRLAALGRHLFAGEVQPRELEDRLLKRLEQDCSEPALSNYLIAIRNPHCFRVANAQPVLDYLSRMVRVHAGAGFDFYWRRSDDDSVEPDMGMIRDVEEYLNLALEKFAGFLAPLVAPGKTKIDVVLDDWGRIRGDTTPLGPIRLNSRITSDANISKRQLLALCAHELFHRVQYSYGFRQMNPDDLSAGQFVEQMPFQYFSEGTASAVENLSFGTVTTDAKLQAIRMHPELGVRKTSYAAFLFWNEYANGGLERIREFLELYRQKARESRSNAIESAFEEGPGSAVAMTLRRALLSEAVVHTAGREPDSSREPEMGRTPVFSKLRVTPVDMLPVEVKGRVEADGMDVFLLTGSAAGAVPVENDLVFVEGRGGSRAFDYTLVLADGAAPEVVAAEWIPPAKTQLESSPRSGVSVAMDVFGNVLVNSENFTDLVLGFQLAAPMSEESKFQRVLSSISNYDTAAPGCGNREFVPGVVEQRDGGYRVQLRSVDLGGIPGFQLESITREVKVLVEALEIKTTLVSANVRGMEFAFLSLMQTTAAVRDSDGGTEPACEIRSGDCDPDTRPAVLRSPVIMPEGGAGPRVPMHLSAGYVAAPISVLSTPGVAEVTYTLLHSFEDFTPLNPPCP